MHNQSTTPVHGAQLPSSFNGPSPLSSPVVSGGTWFETADRPFVLRVERPMSFDEMVAALYGAGLTPGELATPAKVWGHVAVSLTAFGCTWIEHQADQITAAEAAGQLDDAAAEWLATCRDAVAATVRGSAR